MLKIEAIVREESLEDVKAALIDEDIRGITVSQVMGCGTQMGYMQLVRGNRVSTTMLPKIKFEIVVSTPQWAERAIKAIRKAAYSGNPGDGKIFVYEIQKAIRIRTGEEDVEAITPAS